MALNTRSKRQRVVILDSSDSDDCIIQSEPARRVTRSQPSADSSFSCHYGKPATQIPPTSRDRTSKSFFLSQNRNVAIASPTRKSLDLLATRFAPQRVSELGVNPTKVKEVKDWFNRRLKTRGVLLVTGPTGSGKRMTVRLLAEQAGFCISQWEREEEYELNTSIFKNGVSEGNELDSFFKFFRGGRSKVLEQAEGKQTFLFIDHIPQQAFKDLRYFHTMLSHVLSCCRHSVVFSLTDLDSCYELSPKRAFPLTFQRENGIESISFNAVASRFMQTALARIADKLRGTRKISSALLKEAEKAADGDIRCAVNMLEFSLNNETGEGLCSSLEAAAPDEMFHMLGRVLYAKRVTGTTCLLDSSLPEALQRPPTEKDVNHILEMSRANNDTVMLFLHEHEPNFSSSISATRRVFDSLSAADSLCSSWAWETRSQGTAYAAQIAARATMFWNYPPIQIKRRYMFTNPTWRSVEKEIREVNTELQETVHMVPLGADFKKLQLPMLSHLSVGLEDSQIGIVSYLSRPLSFSRLAGRLSWDQSQQHKPLTQRYRVGPRMFSCLNGGSALPVPYSLVEDSSEQVNQPSEYLHIEDSDNESRDIFHDSFDEEPW